MLDITNIIREVAILAVPILMAITFHEVAHGYAALWLGDPTAKDAGRLSFNPIKHLDPLGALALFLVKIGWAKPVPVNPRYFKDPRKGMILVSIAGPITNFILAVFFSIIFHLLLWGFGQSQQSLVISTVQPLLYMCQAGVLVNLGLGVFNLLPVPPLDGSNIVAGLLPQKYVEPFLRFGKYGMVVLIILFISGAVQKVILPVIYGLASLLLPI